MDDPLDFPVLDSWELGLVLDQALPPTERRDRLNALVTMLESGAHRIASTPGEVEGTTLISLAVEGRAFAEYLRANPALSSGNPLLPQLIAAAEAAESPLAYRFWLDAAGRLLGQQSANTLVLTDVPLRTVFPAAPESATLSAMASSTRQETYTPLEGDFEPIEVPAPG
ncbi:MAG: hypothetical protein HC915_17495 [Anaerolineae bacterium]|nr:hypothetical protein [Anaerolineae bacterium]